MDESYDTIIVGAGAAAFGAAIYAARYEMSFRMFGDEFGGETATGGLIENYPGFPSIQGTELMQNMREHAEGLGTDLQLTAVTDIERESDKYFLVRTEDGETHRTKTVVLAVGRERRTLGLEGEDDLVGRGVSYCATCDAAFFRDRRTAVVGGGDSALEGALLLGKMAEHVYIIYRGDEFYRPEPIKLKKLEDERKAGHITPIFSANVVELKAAEGTLEAVRLDREWEGSDRLEVDGLFIEIGADPRHRLASSMGVELNEYKEIAVDRMGRTTLPGFFAAGDVTDASEELKQTITSTAQGVKAVTAAYECLERDGFCKQHARTRTVKRLSAD